MIILALDLARTTGWALSTGESGTWDLRIRRDESSGMPLIRLRGKLNEILKSIDLELIAYEAARHAAPKMQGSLVVLAEMQGVIKAWGEKAGVQFVPFSPTEIKKHATGKGNASKEKMFSAAQEKWPGRAFIDDNEVDAVWILDLIQERLGEK